MYVYKHTGPLIQTYTGICLYKQPSAPLRRRAPNQNLNSNLHHATPRNPGSTVSRFGEIWGCCNFQCKLSYTESPRLGVHGKALSYESHLLYTRALSGAWVADRLALLSLAFGVHGKTTTQKASETQTAARLGVRVYSRLCVCGGRERKK